MKKFFLLSIIMMVIASCAPKQGQEAKEWKAEHVFIIAFDGWGSYCMDSVQMPNTRALMANGAYTFKKRTVLPSDSSPNWASMFAGAPTEFHGWSNNGKGPDVEPIYLTENGTFPTIFYVLRKQFPEAVVGGVYEWGGIKPLVDYKSFDYCVQEDPAKIAATSIAYIKEKKPNLMAVIYDDPDHVGHSAGHDTPAYYQRMEELDAYLGEILEAVKEAGIYDNSIFIITSDHGGFKTGHGGRTNMEMDTPFIIAGKNVKKIGGFSEAMMQYDTAHTIAEIFGLEIPQVWNGKSMSHVFE